MAGPQYRQAVQCRLLRGCLCEGLLFSHSCQALFVNLGPSLQVSSFLESTHLKFFNLKYLSFKIYVYFTFYYFLLEVCFFMAIPLFLIYLYFLKCYDLKQSIIAFLRIVFKDKKPLSEPYRGSLSKMIVFWDKGFFLPHLYLS